MFSKADRTPAMAAATTLPARELIVQPGYSRSTPGSCAVMNGADVQGFVLARRPLDPSPALVTHVALRLGHADGPIEIRWNKIEDGQHPLDRLIRRLTNGLPIAGDVAVRTGNTERGRVHAHRHGEPFGSPRKVR